MMTTGTNLGTGPIPANHQSIQQYNQKIEYNIKSMRDIINEWNTHSNNQDSVLHALQEHSSFSSGAGEDYSILNERIQQQSDTIDKLQQHISKLSGDQQKLDEIVALLRAGESELLSDNQQLQQQIIIQQTEYNQLQCTVDSQIIEIIELTNSIESLKSLQKPNHTTADADDTIDEQNKFHKLQQQCTTYATDTGSKENDSNDTVTLLQNQIQLLRQTVDDKQVELDELHEQHESYVAVAQNTIHTVTNLQQQLQRLEETVNDKQNKLDELQQQYVSCTSDNNTLQEQVNELMKQLNDANTRVELMSSNDNLNSSMEQLELERAAISERQEQLDKSYADLENLRDGLYQRHNDTVSIQLSNDNDQLNTLKKAFAELQENKLQLQHTIDDISGSQRKLQDRLADTIDENNELKQQLANNKTTMHNSNHSDDMIDQLNGSHNDTVQALNCRISELESQHDEAVKLMLQLQQTIDTLSNDKTVLMLQVDTLSSENNQLTQSVDLVHTASQNLPQLQTELSTVQQQLQHTTTQLQQYKSDLNNVQNELHIVQQRYNTLYDEHNILLEQQSHHSVTSNAQRSLFTSPAPSARSHRLFTSPSSTILSTPRSTTKSTVRAKPIRRSSVVTINNLPPARSNSWLEILFILQLILLVVYMFSDSIGSTSAGQSIQKWFQHQLNSNDNTRHIYNTYDY